MTDQLSVTVAGAGIGGLAFGAALAGQGHRVRVAERAVEIAEVGAGIQISPNGFRVIEALGRADALGNVSLRAKRVRLIDGPSGREVVTLDLALKPKLSWQLVHRADLINLLKQAALDAGVDLVTGHEVKPPPLGSSLDGDDLLVGADGVRSAIRAQFEHAADPAFTGQVAWRAVIEEDETEPEVEVHMGPRRHLVSYPLTNGRRNIVAVEERAAWAEEGWSHPDDPANLRAAFAGFSDEVQSWLAAVNSVYVWGLFRHPVVRHWHSGRQVLLGDAAHPTLPFLAQGANLALEDAWVLADALKVHPWDKALAAYQSARSARATRVVDAATRNARNYHLSFPPARFFAHTLLRTMGILGPARMLGRFDWLYEHDVTARHH